MSYIGNTIRAADDYRLIDDISSSFNGSTTSFALQVSGSAPVPFPKSPQQVLISVNGVIQEPDPTGSSGFNLVGTNIVFSSAPTNGHAFFGIIYATADYLNSGGNFPSGSLGAPSITFVSDENTGIYRKGSGSVAFVADATEIANTDSNGLTISSGNLILGDNIQAKFGASNDLNIYHDGSNSRIVDTGTGNLILTSNQVQINNAGNTEVQAKFIENGAVELYHNGTKKFETTAGGATVTGVLNVTSHLDMNDDDHIKLGDGDDLEIFHQSSNNNSIIRETGGGDLSIQTNGSFVNLYDSANARAMAIFTTGGSCSFKHGATTRLETTSTGVAVTGNQTITGTSGADALSIQFTDANGEGFTCIGGSSQGRTNISVKAGNNTSGSITAFRLENSSGTSIGSFHMENDTDDINIFNGSQGGTISFHTSATTNSSGSLPRWRFNDGGSFVPVANNAYNLGGPSNRVANIYTNDLNLSNEGSSNDVDGTWGDWTIQEGESDLFLKNNRSGKKFKFNLTEVS